MVEHVPRHSPSRVSSRPAVLGDALGAGPQTGDYRISELPHRCRVAGGGLLQAEAELARVHGLRAKHMLEDLVPVPAATARPWKKVRSSAMT